VNSASPEHARITWLASYPKSGNTWVRAFLTSYLRPTAPVADINHLDPPLIAGSRILFDRTVGINAACLLPNEVDALRPAVYRQLAAAATEPLFIKVHDAWRYTSAAEPLFPPEVTHRVIYIVRNPLDVAVSAKHHYGQSSELTVEHMCMPNFALDPWRADAPGLQLQQRVGDWSEHVRGWMQAADVPVHVMRYEDMLFDPWETFAQMLRALDIAVDEAQLATAVAAASFQRLQQQEEESGFRERPIRATAPFFRSGKAESWREELEPALAEQLIATHGRMMQALGYLARSV
jgi:hypothetical protein